MRFNNDTELYQAIGANIKQYREQANLTQVQLAEQAKYYFYNEIPLHILGL